MSARHLCIESLVIHYELALEPQFHMLKGLRSPYKAVCCCSTSSAATAGSQYYPSTIRKVNLTSGEVLEQHLLPSQYWGEGLTLFNDTYAR